METIKLKYRILFNLQLTLQDFDGDLNQYFDIKVNNDTSELLAHYQTLNRRQKSAFTFVVRTEHQGSNDGKPWVPISESKIFSFQVKLKDDRFIQNTHLASYDFVNQVLFVTNTTVNMSGNELVISAKPDNYSSAESYPKGYIVRSASTRYKAIQPSDTGDPHGVTETDYWKPIMHMALSQADLVDRSTLTPPVDLDTILLVEIDSSSTLNNNYRLLDASSKVREVIYLVRFENNK